MVVQDTMFISPFALENKIWQQIMSDIQINIWMEEKEEEMDWYAPDCEFDDW